MHTLRAWTQPNRHTVIGGAAMFGGHLTLGDDVVVPLAAGESLQWRMSQDAC